MTKYYLCTFDGNQEHRMVYKLKDGIWYDRCKVEQRWYPNFKIFYMNIDKGLFEVSEKSALTRLRMEKDDEKGM
jgi:hypothetical protein